MREILIQRYSMRLFALMNAHAKCHTFPMLRANLRLQEKYRNLIKCLNNGLH